jgi:hypothetical protein
LVCRELGSILLLYGGCVLRTVIVMLALRVGRLSEREPRNEDQNDCPLRQFLQFFLLICI